MSQDILDLKGRIAIATGAGQGVGRQVALHLGGHAAGGVVVNDVRLERAEAVAKEVEALGCRALAIAADVTDRDAVNETSWTVIPPFSAEGWEPSPQGSTPLHVVRARYDRRHTPEDVVRSRRDPMPTVERTAQRGVARPNSAW